jgi:serine/threonine protein phosphatase 1
MQRRSFVIGDIHGAYRALEQCFESSHFDIKNDELICLGDVCDSWPEVDKVIEKLLDVTYIYLIAGNHDQWALDWFLYKKAPSIWTGQGGNATVESYKGKHVPERHVSFLANALPYYIKDNILFVHGGIIAGMPLENQTREVFLWDRSLVSSAMIMQNTGRERNLTGYDEVYVGHTPTLRYGDKKPLRACEVIMMDTGAGWPGGVLSMMDIQTGKVFASDDVSILYKGIQGRQ